MSQSDYPILRAEIARARKQPLLTRKTTTMTQCSNHHPSLSTLRPKGLSRSMMKW